MAEILKCYSAKISELQMMNHVKKNKNDICGKIKGLLGE